MWGVILGRCTPSLMHLAWNGVPLPFYRVQNLCQMWESITHSPKPSLHQTCHPKKTLLEMQRRYRVVLEPPGPRAGSIHSQPCVRHYLKSRSLGAPCLGVHNSPPPQVQSPPNLVTPRPPAPERSLLEMCDDLGASRNQKQLYVPLNHFSQETLLGKHLVCGTITPPPPQSNPHLAYQRKVHWRHNLNLGLL